VRFPPLPLKRRGFHRTISMTKEPIRTLDACQEALEAVSRELDARSAIARQLLDKIDSFEASCWLYLHPWLRDT